MLLVYPHQQKKKQRRIFYKTEAQAKGLKTDL